MTRTVASIVGGQARPGPPGRRLRLPNPARTAEVTSEAELGRASCRERV